MTDWDSRYLEMARLVAGWSKDRSTKVGAVIVGEAGQILSTGFNGFPRGVNDDVDERHERPAKYLYTEHAERNAIYNAARLGVQLLDSRMYVDWPPCSDCARGIIQAGIGEVVIGFAAGVVPERWDGNFAVSAEMLYEAGITIRRIG